jgi:hypothetical protein
MESGDMIQDRMRARDAAMRLLNRLTAGAAVSAVVGVGLLGAIGAYTIPGTASTSTSTASSSSSTSSSSGLQTSTTPVTSSSSSGVAVSGGS